jgi:hypothetical protein
VCRKSSTLEPAVDAAGGAVIAWGSLEPDGQLVHELNLTRFAPGGAIEEGSPSSRSSFASDARSPRK